MKVWRHNNLFFIEHDFINIMNKLWKFHVNIISLSKVIIIYITPSIELIN